MRAVLLDALGTLVELESPVPHLRRALPQLSADDAARALAAEMAYYREHLNEGRDPATLAALHRRCAAVLRDALPERVRPADLDELVAVLLASLRFRPFPDARPALAALRARGLRLVVVSNWDCSLPATLERIGLAPLLDGMLASASVGARKPAPRVFERALELAGVAASDSVHVGDSVVEDAAGARAAGIEPVLLRRDGAPGPRGLTTIATLAELERVLDTLT